MVIADIVNISDYRRRVVLTQKDKILRRIEDMYEYCLIKDYDVHLDFTEAQAVQVGQVFANFVLVGDRPIFVSIQFPIHKFNLDEVINWLDHFGIHWQEKGKDVGTLKAAEIIEGLKFFGNTILLYQKGHTQIEYDPDQYKEITDVYVQFKMVTDTNTVKPIDLDNNEPCQKVFINGEQVDEVPRIEFEQENLIISNGNFISVDYIEDFYGCVAFFRQSDPGLPVAWIHDKKTAVYIELQENDDFGQVCIVKFNYEIDLEAL